MIVYLSVVALIFPAARLKAGRRISEDGKPEHDGDVELVSAELVWVEVREPRASKDE